MTPAIFRDRYLLAALIMFISQPERSPNRPRSHCLELMSDEELAKVA